MDLINAEKMEHIKILEGLHLTELRKYKIINFFPFANNAGKKNGDIHYTIHM
jgi:hypothetical protein